MCDRYSGSWPVLFLVAGQCDENFCECPNCRTLADRLTPFQVVNRSAVDTVSLERGDGVGSSVVVGVNLRHHGDAELGAKRAPLGQATKVASEQNRVRRR